MSTSSPMPTSSQESVAAPSTATPPAASRHQPQQSMHSITSSTGSTITATGIPPSRPPKPTATASVPNIDQHNLFNSTVFDLLLAELIPLSRRVVADIAEMNTKGSEPAAEDSKTKQDEEDKIYKPLPLSILHEYPNMVPVSDENVFFRTELYGFHVGRSLAEVISRDSVRLTSQLDGLKFICKDLWNALYSKPIDNLKTNHRGTYVLIDQSFKPCERMGSQANLPMNAFFESQVPSYKNLKNNNHNNSGTPGTGPNSPISNSHIPIRQSPNLSNTPGNLNAGPGRVAAAPFIWFHLGIIRGALLALGIEATVSFDAPQLPVVSFNVHTTHTTPR